MNIAKKIRASANCRYGDPPVTVKKKVPSNAIAPTTAHTAVTTLEVRLSNRRERPLSSLMGSEAIVPERVHYLLQEGLGYSFWPFLLLGLIHWSAWKGNSGKSALKVREGAGEHAVP